MFQMCLFLYAIYILFLVPIEAFLYTCTFQSFYHPFLFLQHLCLDVFLLIAFSLTSWLDYQLPFTLLHERYFNGLFDSKKPGVLIVVGRYF